MFLPKPSENGNFEMCPAGTFTAICYRFIDRGTQANEYNGERKMRHEVMLSWEIVGETMEDGRPFSISKTYTFSTHEKANFRKDLEAWRGKAFTDEDFEGPNAFNTRKLLGIPCTLSVSHTTKGEKTRANVASLGKAMKGIQIPALVNPIAYLALTKEDYDAAVYGALSDRVKETIARSPEHQDIMRNSHRADDPGEGPNNFEPDYDMPF